MDVKECKGPWRGRIAIYILSMPAKAVRTLSLFVEEEGADERGGSIHDLPSSLAFTTALHTVILPGVNRSIAMLPGTRTYTSHSDPTVGNSWIDNSCTIEYVKRSVGMLSMFCAVCY